MDEKKAGREMRNSNPQFEFNLLRRQHFCFIPRGSCGGVGGVGGSYWFGKYYDGRSPGFLFIITAMSPPFCAGIPGNYNTSNWCFNSSGRDHRQVNTRLEVAQRLACSHTRRERGEITFRSTFATDIIVMSTNVTLAIVPSFVSYFTLQYRRESRFIKASQSLLSTNF